jgi:hypothetical protein
MDCKVEIGTNQSNLCLRVSGYATYAEATQLSEFLKVVRRNENFNKVFFDLAECEKMDSTFMGIIASLACEEEGEDKFSVEIASCSDSALDCLEDLGLTTLVPMSEDWDSSEFSFLPLEEIEYERKNQQDVIILSHEILSSINDSNREKFSAVIQALNAEKH